MDDYRKIYQQLPEDTTTLTRSGENIRPQQCSQWLSDLQKKHQNREHIYKKYNRARSTLDLVQLLGIIVMCGVML